MNEQNTSISFLSFAWHSLTEQQQYRINVKYELKVRLDNRGCRSKASVYRAIADEYGYTFDRIKDIAKQELKDN